MKKSAGSIQSYQLKAKLFRGLSDRSRLSILEILRDGGCIVGEIADATGLTQPNVSNHLKCLSECGLVVGQPNGRFVHYRLSDHRISRLLKLADQLLAGTARLIQECENYQASCVRSNRPAEKKTKSKLRLLRDTTHRMPTRRLRESGVKLRVKNRIAERSKGK